MIYKYYLNIGDIYFELISLKELTLSEYYEKYQSKMHISNISIYIKDLPENYKYPAHKIGEDLILDYYYENKKHYAAAKPGTAGSVTIVEYDDFFHHVNYYINERNFPNLITSIDKILQLFPLREFLIRKRSFLFHSSQIEYHHKGILFSAPSGTGKTTQAKLWKQYEGAKMVCNDRTLIRCSTSAKTYGFPVDGSEPIASNLSFDLGAIVILKQAKDNKVVKLSSAKKIKYLMEQTVMDTWNIQEMGLIRQYWINIIRNYPVYMLECNISEDAVECLKQQLILDGVI